MSMSEPGEGEIRPPGAKETTDVETGRSRAVESEVRIGRRVPPFFAVLFYGFLMGVAWVWVRGAGGSVAALWIPRNLLLELLLGVFAGIILVGTTPWLVAHVRSLRDLEREFGWVLGEQRAGECIVLAILSGVAEEFFFRGAMLFAVGPWLALAVFAALHWPIQGQWRMWPVTAAAAGVIFTAEFLVTRTLIAPVLTHVIVNAVHLLRISRRYHVWKE